ncbi:MAG: O-antigen ligase family protein [Actinobacteria bacterium]|nr:O-antigen ligase family protein [Actinomycetota bacterium]
MSGRLARAALLVLVVGLVGHNLAMALLWQAGVRDTALDVVAGWKEVLLVIGVLAALAAAWGGRGPDRSGPYDRLAWVDRLALAYGAIVVVYWLVPQAWLGGEASPRGELYALRHHLLPLGAYVLGRLVVLDRASWRRLLVAVVGVAAALSVWGLVDVYAVPLQWWRDSGVPDWYSEQLGLEYDCLSGLPENWILNTDEESPARRLVSTFLSPLASAYLLVVAVLLVAAARPRPWTLGLGAVAFAGLLWTHTRAAFLALPVGLALLAVLRRSPRLAVLAGGSLAVAVAFVALFPTIGPTTTYTATELSCLRENAAVEGDSSDDPFSADESSTASHLRALRDGLETVARQPWGYGLGNAGVSAARTGVDVKAGESTYTELGVDTGILGLAAFVAWLGALGLALRRRSPWLAATLAAVAVLGLQTDVIGIHWLAVAVFAFAGTALRAAPNDPPPERVL